MYRWGTKWGDVVKLLNDSAHSNDFTTELAIYLFYIFNFVLNMLFHFSN